MLDVLAPRKIEAWAFGSETFHTEAGALRAAIAKRIGNNKAIAQNIMDSAKDLVPLLQRAAELTETERKGQ